MFDDIPDDLASIPIDDLFFSEYLDNMSSHLLEPSTGSADAAFSGSHSENQQLDGMCKPPIQTRVRINAVGPWTPSFSCRDTVLRQLHLNTQGVLQLKEGASRLDCEEDYRSHPPMLINEQCFASKVCLARSTGCNQLWCERISTYIGGRALRLAPRQRPTATTDSSDLQRLHPWTGTRFLVPLLLRTMAMRQKIAHTIE